MTTIDSSATVGALSTADQAAVAAIPGQVAKAWEVHDADAFAEIFTEDGTMILPGVFTKGREGIRSFMAQAFAGPFRGTRVVGQPLNLNVLTADSVVLTTVGGILAPGEEEVADSRAIRASWILVRRDGGWLLGGYHNSPRDAAS